MTKKTVVFGASPNPNRYAFLAANKLNDFGHEIVPVGIKKGSVAGEEIINLREKPSIEDIHTVTMYVGPQNQDEWVDYILNLNPKRIIFNPGSENPELAGKAQKNGILVEYGCTLVMLSAGTY